jgi:hypothetical protein
MIENDYRSKSR